MNDITALNQKAAEIPLKDPINPPRIMVAPDYDANGFQQSDIDEFMAGYDQWEPWIKKLITASGITFYLTNKGLPSDYHQHIPDKRLVIVDVANLKDIRSQSDNHTNIMMSALLCAMHDRMPNGLDWTKAEREMERNARDNGLTLEVNTAASVLGSVHRTRSAGNGQQLRAVAPISASVYLTFMTAAKEAAKSIEATPLASAAENAPSQAAVSASSNSAHVLGSEYFYHPNQPAPEFDAPFEYTGPRFATHHSLVLTPFGLIPVREALSADPDTLSSIKYALAIFEPEHCKSEEAFAQRLKEERERLKKNHVTLPEHNGQRLNVDRFFERFENGLVQLYSYAYEYNDPSSDNRINPERFPTLRENIAQYGVIQPVSGKYDSNKNFIIAWGANIHEVAKQLGLDAISTQLNRCDPMVFGKEIPASTMYSCEGKFAAMLSEEERNKVVQAGTVIVLDGIGLLSMSADRRPDRNTLISNAAVFDSDSSQDITKKFLLESVFTKPVPFTNEITPPSVKHATAEEQERFNKAFRTLSKPVQYVISKHVKCIKDNASVLQKQNYTSDILCKAGEFWLAPSLLKGPTVNLSRYLETYGLSAAVKVHIPTDVYKSGLESCIDYAMSNTVSQGAPRNHIKTSLNSVGQRHLIAQMMMSAMATIHNPAIEDHREDLEKIYRITNDAAQQEYEAYASSLATTSTAPAQQPPAKTDINIPAPTLENATSANQAKFTEAFQMLPKHEQYTIAKHVRFSLLRDADAGAHCKKGQFFLSPTLMKISTEDLRFAIASFGLSAAIDPQLSQTQYDNGLKACIAYRRAKDTSKNPPSANAIKNLVTKEGKRDVIANIILASQTNGPEVQPYKDSIKNVYQDYSKIAQQEYEAYASNLATVSTAPAQQQAPAIGLNIPAPTLENATAEQQKRFAEAFDMLEPEVKHVIIREGIKFSLGAYQGKDRDVLADGTIHLISDFDRETPYHISHRLKYFGLAASLKVHVPEELYDSVLSAYVKHMKGKSGRYVHDYGGTLPIPENVQGAVAPNNNFDRGDLKTRFAKRGKINNIALMMCNYMNLSFTEAEPIVTLYEEAAKLEYEEDKAKQVAQETSDPARWEALYKATDTAFVINCDPVGGLTAKQQAYFDKLNEVLELLEVSPKEFDDQFKFSVAHTAFICAGKLQRSEMAFCINSGAVVDNNTIEKINKETDYGHLPVSIGVGEIKGKTFPAGHVSVTLDGAKHLDALLGFVALSFECINLPLPQEATAAEQKVHQSIQINTPPMFKNSLGDRQIWKPSGNLALQRIAALGHKDINVLINNRHSYETNVGHYETDSKGKVMMVSVANAALTLAKRKNIGAERTQQLENLLKEIDSLGEAMCKEALIESGIYRSGHYTLSPEQRQAARQDLPIANEVDAARSLLDTTIDYHDALGKQLFSDPIIRLAEKYHLYITAEDADKKKQALSSLQDAYALPEVKTALNTLSVAAKVVFSTQPNLFTDENPVWQKGMRASQKAFLDNFQKDCPALYACTNGKLTQAIEDATKPLPYIAAISTPSGYDQEFKQQINDVCKNINTRFIEHKALGDALFAGPMKNYMNALVTGISGNVNAALDSGRNKGITSALENAKSQVLKVLAITQETCDAEEWPDYEKLQKSLRNNILLIAALTDNRQLMNEVHANNTDDYRELFFEERILPALRGEVKKPALEHGGNTKQGATEQGRDTTTTSPSSTGEVTPAVAEHGTATEVPTIMPAVTAAAAIAATTLPVIAASAGQPQQPIQEVSASPAQPVVEVPPVEVRSVKPHMAEIAQPKEIIEEDESSIPPAEREKRRAQAYQTMLETLQMDAAAIALNMDASGYTQFRCDADVNGKHARLRLLFRSENSSLPPREFIYDLNSSHYAGGYARLGVVPTSMDVVNLRIAVNSEIATDFSPIFRKNKSGKPLVSKDDFIPTRAIFPNERELKVKLNKSNYIYQLELTSRGSIKGEDITIVFPLGVKGYAGDDVATKVAEDLAGQRAKIIENFIDDFNRGEKRPCKIPIRRQIQEHLEHKILQIHNADAADPLGHWERPKETKLLDVLGTYGLRSAYLELTDPAYQDAKKAKDNSGIDALLNNIPAIVTLEDDEEWQTWSYALGNKGQNKYRHTKMELPTVDGKGVAERQITTIGAPILSHGGSGQTYHLDFALYIQDDPSKKTAGDPIRGRHINLCIDNLAIARSRAEEVIYGNEANNNLGLRDLVKNYFDQRPQARWSLEVDKSKEETKTKKLSENMEEIVKSIVHPEVIEKYKDIVATYLLDAGSDHQLLVERGNASYGVLPLTVRIAETTMGENGQPELVMDASGKPKFVMDTSGKPVEVVATVKEGEADVVERYLRGDMDYQRLELIINDLIPRFEHDLSVQHTIGASENGMIPVTFSVMRGRRDGTLEQHLDSNSKPLRRQVLVPESERDHIEEYAKRVHEHLSMLALTYYSAILPDSTFETIPYDTLAAQKAAGGNFIRNTHPDYNADKPIGWLEHAINSNKAFVFRDLPIEVKPDKTRTSSSSSMPDGKRERVPSTILGITHQVGPTEQMHRGF